MSEQDPRTRSSILEVVVWCVATPILSIWALLSVLPFISLVRAWGDVGAVLSALGFLASGAVGVIAAVMAYRLLLWSNSNARVGTSEMRTTRVAVLSAYAVVWMAFYAI